jgi:diaminopimelate epimerase
MKFFKYEGTGNDFLILDTQIAPSTADIKRICDRHFGLGADGILFASESNKAEIKMNYYNADGTIAKMCGNGLRCFVNYLNDQSIITAESYVVETGAGLIEVTRQDGLVEMNLGTAIVQPLTQIEQYPLYPVSLATEHAVVFEGVDQRELIGPLVTNHVRFNDGVNTNFVTVQGPNSIFVQTHERGAGWTMSCGTGAAASAACAVELGIVTSPVQVGVPGGTLEVRVASDVFLKGPANKVAEGVWL